MNGNEFVEITEEIPPRKKKRSGKKALLIILTVLVLLSALSYLAYLATADFRSYGEALSLFEQTKYQDAAKIFEKLGDFKDSAEKLSQSRYEIACDLKSDRDYLNAIEAFEALDGYKDSDYLIKTCYYALGHQAYSFNSKVGSDYAKAIEYFTLADDYYNANEYKNKAIEKHAVKLFSKGAFNKAEEYFAMLDEEYAAELPPRFTDISETPEYFHQCTENLTEEIELYVGNGSDDMFGADYEHLFTYLPGRGYSSVNYSSSTGLLKIKMFYRAGDRIIYAEKNGKHDILIPEEKEVLEKAKLIVDEAKANSSTEFELELWIHDWICQNTEYNTPDLEKDEQIPDIGYRQHSCIGGLLDGKINCQGYADTFELLGTLAGLEIRTVGGMAVNEEGEGHHAWNMIKLDGLWYFVDVTYDDPSGMPDEMLCRIWLNTPYSIDRHTPYITLNEHYDFAEEENPAYSYYDVKNLNFTTEKDIAKYAVDMHGKRVETVSVRAEALELSEDKINSLIRSTLESYGYTYASWRLSVQYENGNTYVTVLWD